ncbi:unnamed protein product, partial [marine sediment metagenome]
MNRDPVLFRVDGANGCGWERLNRCLTIAAALQRRRRPTFFLSKLEPASLPFAIKRGGNEWLEADEPAGTENDLVETIQEIRRRRPAAVVVDAERVAADYLAELAQTGVLIVSLDHLANIRFPSHLVINPLLEPGRDAYDFFPDTQLLLGRRYAIVRPEIRRVRQLRSQDPSQPFRTVIAIGEASLPQTSSHLAKLLLPVARLSRIDFVARPIGPEAPKLQTLVAAHPDRLDFVREPGEVSARLARCHFA